MEEKALYRLGVYFVVTYRKVSNQHVDKARTMFRAQPVGNKILYDSATNRDKKKHMDRLRSIQASVDNGKPASVVAFEHRRNLKKEYLEKERFLAIDRDNLNLMGRMRNIMKRSPRGPKSIVESSNARPTNKSIVRASAKQQSRRRTRKQRSIQKNNTKIADRIENIKSFYNNESLAKDWENTESYFRRACHLPVADGMLTSPRRQKRGRKRKGGRNRRLRYQGDVLSETIAKAISRKQAETRPQTSVPATALIPVNRPSTSYHSSQHCIGDSPRRPQQSRSKQGRYGSSGFPGRKLREPKDDRKAQDAESTFSNNEKRFSTGEDISYSGDKPGRVQLESLLYSTSIQSGITSISIDVYTDTVKKGMVFKANSKALKNKYQLVLSNESLGLFSASMDLDETSHGVPVELNKRIAESISERLRIQLVNRRLQLVLIEWTPGLAKEQINNRIEEKRKEEEEVREQVSAAQKIQARHRGRKARQLYQQKQNEKKELDMQVSAAKRIQSRHRGNQVRKDAKEKALKKRVVEEQTLAARKIQARHRGRKAREEVSGMIREKEEMKRQAAAARKIQSRHRGRQVRREVKKQNDAITKIQARHRGRKARENVRAKKTTMSAEATKDERRPDTPGVEESLEKKAEEGSAPAVQENVTVQTTKDDGSPPESAPEKPEKDSTEHSADSAEPSAGSARDKTVAASEDSLGAAETPPSETVAPGTNDSLPRKEPFQETTEEDKIDADAAGDSVEEMSSVVEEPNQPSPEKVEALAENSMISESSVDQSVSDGAVQEVQSVAELEKSSTVPEQLEEPSGIDHQHGGRISEGTVSDGSVQEMPSVQELTKPSVDQSSSGGPSSIEESSQESAHGNETETESALAAKDTIERSDEEKIDAFFSQYCETPSSSLLAFDGVKKMLVDWSRPLNKAPEDVTESEIKAFISHLDHDGNGVIHKKEFREFCTEGMFLRLSERRRYAKQSSLHGKLMWLITNVERHIGKAPPTPSSSPSPSVTPSSRQSMNTPNLVPVDSTSSQKANNEITAQDLESNYTLSEDHARVMLQSHFRNYCTTPQGRNLDRDQFAALMADFSAKGDFENPTESEINNFMEAMDTDGSGLLDEQEWVSFMMRGFQLDDRAASAFANRSTMHLKCIGAIQAAKIDAFRRATVIHDVFTKYDEDNSGYIDANEMKTMIADTIAKSDPQPPSDSEVALFMGALDPDGSGHVHEEDIIRFFMGGAAQNEQRRRNFANRSPMHAKLDHFINYVLLSAHMGDH